MILNYNIKNYADHRFYSYFGVYKCILHPFKQVSGKAKTALNKLTK